MDRSRLEDGGSVLAPDGGSFLPGQETMPPYSTVVPEGSDQQLYGLCFFNEKSIDLIT